MDETPSPSMYASNSEIASISAKIMIATIAVVFILMLIFFCVYIYAKCQMSFTYLEDPNVVAWRRREARRARGRGPGLDPSELESIPIVVYNPKEFKDGLECAVCLSEVTQGEKARILPKCNHGFHVNCIDMWLQSHSTCPICRNPIVPLQNPSNVPNEVQENGSSSSDSDEDDYASIEAPSEEETTSSASLRREELVIEVPTVIFEDCQEELQEKSPVMTRMMSFKRLLSRGKRAMAPSPRASSSRDAEQQV